MTVNKVISEAKKFAHTFDVEEDVEIWATWMYGFPKYHEVAPYSVSISALAVLLHRSMRSIRALIITQAERGSDIRR